MDFSDRCDSTYRIGPNRQQRRDVARATRKKGAPRGAAPVHPAVLAMALRLRENALATDGSVQGTTGNSLVPADGADGAVVPHTGGDDGLQELPSPRGLRNLRSRRARHVGRLGR
jgi:hypothetical protein